MNIPPSEAARLDLPTYHAVLDNWNEMQGPDEGMAPDPAIVMPMIDAINADPRFVN